MTNAELSGYILHYLKADRTKSAIMLTGGWGTGKSHYIQNELIPFLESEKNGKHQCVVVSLYGLKETGEISRSLYLESRMKRFAKKSKKWGEGKFVAKTIIKGIPGLWGMSLSASTKDLQTLYNSVDLSGKLVVLEDIERSDIDVLTVLGYVNSLVKQDGVKVLLVANENEILNYHNSEPDKDGKVYKIPDAYTATYLKTKEKTVSDTISYQGDLKNAISSIICAYGNEHLKSFLSEEKLNDIITLMTLRQNCNLRSFIFACQKIVDIFEKIDTYEDDFITTIFFSIVAFSMIIKDGSFPAWDGTDLISTKLGGASYPLYRFCYDYIRWQEFDGNKVQPTIDAHKKLRLFDRHGDTNYDCDLSVLFSYHNYYEKDVLAALKNIENRLADPENIPFYSYTKLAYYLVACHTILDFDYSLCKERMVSNLRSNEENLDIEVLFLDRFEFDNDKEKAEFADFSKTLREATNYSSNVLGFSYSPEEIPPYYKYVVRNEEQVTSGHAFISKFDLEKFVDMIFCCNPAQLQDLRGILFAIYRHSTKGDFMESDAEFMEELISKINEVLSEKSASMDRIVLMQVKLLIGNLQRFIKQLS